MSGHGFTLALRAFALAGLLLAGSVGATGLHNDTREFTPPGQMTPADWSDPAETERAWQAALVRVPTAGGVVATTIADLPTAGLEQQPPRPTVIYLHGCSGIWPGTYRRIDFLAANGYAVIAPASLARLKYPQSCDVAGHRGGLYRQTLRMRQHDAAHAIEQARKLPWVDGDNLYLMGLSEGAITTATLAPAGAATGVNARVVEGWTCHAGWHEYHGVNAPPSEPVLSLVAQDDPWFRNDWNRGDCGRFLDPGNGSRSVVYEDETLRGRHELLADERVQREVLDFLLRHRHR